MNKQNYKWSVYFIAITIITTIAVQVYWNFREYQINKQHLISKVQLSLDNSVEAYYANLTKEGIITYSTSDSLNTTDKTDTIIVKTNSRYSLRKKMDSAIQNLVKAENSKPLLIKNTKDNQYPFFTSDNSFPKNIDSLISKIIVSISKDSLNLSTLNTYLSKELKRNHIKVRYGLKFNYRYKNDNDSIVYKTDSLMLAHFPKKHLTTESNSTFLPHRSLLELVFTNETATLLRASFISILLSFLLSICIIASLLYLLKTIYKQKQLAEVKNDLINNITHEFKTPIATISTALEALKNFNALDDKTKSEKYISMANNQVEKLTFMVEKILETATLNNNNLKLSKQSENISELIKEVIEKHKLINNSKTIHFENKGENIVLEVDKFHFENAIGNIIDNAIKYGGDSIFIALTNFQNRIQISIKDNGNGIPKSQKEKVFEQFYRIPTGNTHNVKGFGIGLYYSKNIIESHGGTIQINYDTNNNTVFKIELPND